MSSFSTKEGLVAGVEFGGYVVRERIGRGGMATVYRAEHLLLNKPVALKVMDRSLLESGAGLQRFLLEGRAAAAIKHPNVVDITDVGVHDGVPYLVMELLRGRDLEAHLVERRVLDDGSVIRLALPVVAALQTAHERGVVHRDIKPSNIFLSIGPDDQVVPKVLDFGISKVSFGQATIELVTTPQHQLLGTPRYLPPEALQGARELGPLSDQYSLGVVLYHCLTGRTPFAGDTLLALLESLSRGTFEPPRKLQPNVSPGLERVIMRALRPDPNERFPTIRDMGRALLELAAERTQIVWGRAFPALPGGRGERTATAERLAPATPFPARRTERLTPDRVPRPARWRGGVLAAGLVLSGALGATLWPALRGSRNPAPERAAPLMLQPVRAAPPAAAPAAPATGATAPAALTTTPAVLGANPSVSRAATPARAVAAPARGPRPRPPMLGARPRLSDSPRSRRAAPSAARPARSSSRRGPTAASARRTREGRAVGRSSSAREPLDERAGDTAASPPPAPPSPAPTAPPPRQGANGSPLLD